MFNSNLQYQQTPQFNQNQHPNFQQPYQSNYGYPQTYIQQTPYYMQSQVKTIENQRPSVLYGRVVNSVEEIMPNEVAMDGNVSLFPTKDFSCIYAKAWNADGTIKTVEFVPSSNTSTQNEPVETHDVKSLVEKCDVLITKCNELLSQL